MDQIEKNTVPAENQLNGNEYITFEGNLQGHPRILFVGNSITRHGVLESIGWYNDFGMAASSAEKDYVHLIKKWTEQKNPDTAICICQASDWERGYADEGWSNERYSAARNFNADYIIFRLIENVKYDNFNHTVFTEAVRKFLDYLNPGSRAQVIMTTGFWRHTGDVDLVRIAKEDGYALAELGVLGDDDSMKAIGLFEHTGVANHPDDKGMSAIAEAIENLIQL